jgi:periplasmic mercuric ion binding protein
MSSERQIKKIDLETLDREDRKVSLGKLRKGIIGLVLLVVIAGGVYGGYRLVAGEVVASRFAVNKMTCPACVITVQEVTEKLPGVVKTDVSLAGQDVMVKFRNNRTNPDEIKGAIVKAGYPTILDGTFKPSAGGIDDPLVAKVNGKPIFGRDMKTPMVVDDPKVKTDQASAFFSVVGKEILLQAADAKTIVVQPHEIDEEIAIIAKKQGISPEELQQQNISRFGSREKFLQIMAQRLALRKLLDEHVVQGVQDPEERKRKTLQWAGALFKDSEVEIVDPAIKEKVRSIAGQEDWKTFWPRMVSGETELKNLLFQ